jgi:ADP-ribose pyrophosphatase YjhB (NUDIX family)
LIVSDLRALRDLLDRRPEPYGPVATVGALIEDGRKRILMIRTHKWQNLWGIPGGKIRRGESHADALHREIREETALEISEPRLVMVQDSINSPEFMRPEHFLLLNYLVHSADTHVILNDEAEEFCWLTPNDALALDLNQPTRSLIEHCLNQNLI